MMITMTNNLLCILHDVGYIQIQPACIGFLYSYFSIFIWFSHGRSVLCADIVLSDAWLGAVVCESNMMITMTNNLLCILQGNRGILC